MTDKYRNFAELEQYETADEDYTLLYRFVNTLREALLIFKGQL